MQIVDINTPLFNLIDVLCCRVDSVPGLILISVVIVHVVLGATNLPDGSNTIVDFC